MRKKYTTSIEEIMIKRIKLQAVEEGRAANDIIEEAMMDYFKKKGVEFIEKK